jgi:hypothetical protein
VIQLLAICWIAFHVWGAVIFSVAGVTLRDAQLDAVDEAAMPEWEHFIEFENLLRLGEQKAAYEEYKHYRRQGDLGYVSGLPGRS